MLNLGLGFTHLFLLGGCGLLWCIAFGLVSLVWPWEFGDAAGAQSSFWAFRGATMVQRVATNQTLQAAVALSKDSVFLWALIVMFAAIMCSAASIAFDRILGGLASFQCSIVPEHVASTALDERWTVPTVDERYLCTKHIYPFVRGLLCDRVVVVDVGNEDSRDIFS
jgi:hypothetical protein